jgi:hypothetical protein
MSKIRFIWLLISLFMVYTEGLWERLFLLPPGTTIMVEIPVWIYLALSYKEIMKSAPARSIFIYFILISFIVGVFNESKLISWAKYIRFLVYFYLIYSSLWNSNLKPVQWKNLLKFAVFLIIMQGLGAAFNIFILNQRVEGYVGLMSSLGGTTASTFPLLIVTIAAIIYFFLKRKNVKANVYLLLISMSVILVGYQSGKRAIFISVPIFLMLVIIFSWKELKTSFFNKKFIGLILVLALSLPFYFYGIVNSRGFNYGLKGNENNTEILLEALRYTQTYTEATSGYGETIGRFGTSLQVIDKSFKNPKAFLFGYGYGSAKEASTKLALGIYYGVVGFTRDLISGGWLIMILTVLLLSKSILTNKSINYKFTNELRLLIFAVFLYTHFFYASDFTADLKVNFLMLLLLVFINSPKNHVYLKTVVERYFYPSLRR